VKNPLPWFPSASIDATACMARRAVSSILGAAAGAGDAGSARTSGGAGAVRATGAEVTSPASAEACAEAAGAGGSGPGSASAVSGPGTLVSGAGAVAGRVRRNATAATARQATMAPLRGTEIPLAGAFASTGVVATVSTGLGLPQRHSSIRGGTRRPHVGHVQAPGEGWLALTSPPVVQRLPALL